MDADGVEVLAFGSDGTLVGALVMNANLGEDSGQPLLTIDANFPDGYASIPIFADDLTDSTTTGWRVDADIDRDEAARRVQAMLGFIELDLQVATESLRGPSRRQCKVMFITAAAVCGVGAFTANPGIVLACLANETNVICNCAKYIPIKICD